MHHVGRQERGQAAMLHVWGMCCVDMVELCGHAVHVGDSGAMCESCSCALYCGYDWQLGCIASGVFYPLVLCNGTCLSMQAVVIQVAGIGFEMYSRIEASYARKS